MTHNQIVKSVFTDHNNILHSILTMPLSSMECIIDKYQPRRMYSEQKGIEYILQLKILFILRFLMIKRRPIHLHFIHPVAAKSYPADFLRRRNMMAQLHE